jgi:hypothetical protein
MASATQPKEVVMSHISIRRSASALVAIAVSLLGFVLCAPSAFALVMRPAGGEGSPTGSSQPAPATVHNLVATGMAGWEIALIAIGAAIVAAVLAVFTERIRALRRRVALSAA